MATLDSGQPAVTLRDVGGAGGQAAAFTYDLARSVVYTRQGNPAWAGTERDGNAEAIRSDDMFFGGTQPDWVDLNRVQVPAADEQQRMLANLVIGMENDRMPLPRFWYLPRGLKAAVVLTGDDHNYDLGGTNGQFNRYLADSPPGCSVAAVAVRALDLLPLPGNVDHRTPRRRPSRRQGFEIALHLWVSGPRRQASGDGNCHNFPSRVASPTTSPRSSQVFRSTYPSLDAPATNRNHCIIYSDWSSVPHVELAKGIRLDTNYYYWPASWVAGPAGLLHRLGLPAALRRDRRLAHRRLPGRHAAHRRVRAGHRRARSGSCSTTRIGPAGFYGVVTANMHTDDARHPGADAIIAAAQARGVPDRLGAPDAHVARRPQHVVLPGAGLQRRAPELQRGPGRRRDRARRRCSPRAGRPARCRRSPATASR